MSRTWVLISVSVVSLAVGALGFKIWNDYEHQLKLSKAPTHDDELHLGLKGFVNPLLDCGPGSVSSLKESEIRDRVENYINDAKAKGIVKYAAIYYRDLNNGPTFGIDSNELFTPASLLKVPIMIAYLKRAQEDSSYLKKTFVYQEKRDGGGNVTQNIQPPEPLVDGRAYTVEDLIDRMIVKSDNEAAAVLANQKGEINIEKTLSEMGVPVVVSENQVWLRVVSYSSIFRILYNATYLNPFYSSLALELMSKSEFKAGLVAGIPIDKNEKVAHKFGEREISGDYQLHDCGIIYDRETPYLLCVMTRGKNFTSLSKVIAAVSDIVYKTINEQ